jgi:AcrR family transcriptional regulator
MTEAVKTQKRTRRAEKARATQRQIVDAATRLFLERGYVPTTIDAIAQAADVAVETVYARFGNKTGLMVAVKEAAVTEGGEVPLEERPELATLAAETDQRRQLRFAAALSRAMLQRISPVYALLREAAGTDEALRQHLAAEIDRRRRFQRTVMALVCARGPLRGQLALDQAAETYSALANPDLYLLVTIHHGWTPEHFEGWLAESLQVLLLPDADQGGC